jgi:hypothetical protein
VEFAKQFGMAGPFVAYLIWNQTSRDKLDAARTAADVEMAKALTQLSERLNHVR